MWKRRASSAWVGQLCWKNSQRHLLMKDGWWSGGILRDLFYCILFKRDHPNTAWTISHTQSPVAERGLKKWKNLLLDMIYFHRGNNANHSENTICRNRIKRIGQPYIHSQSHRQTDTKVWTFSSNVWCSAYSSYISDVIPRYFKRNDSVIKLIAGPDWNIYSTECCDRRRYLKGNGSLYHPPHDYKGGRGQKC